MEGGAPEAPYYRPEPSNIRPPSPPKKNVPRRLTEKAQVTQAKRGRDQSRERQISRERRHELEEIIVEATQKLRDQASTEAERATAIREIHEATKDLGNEKMDGAPRN